MSRVIDIFKKELHNYFEDLSKNNTLASLGVEPHAFGWKVANVQEFNKTLGSILTIGIQQLHVGVVNERYIASVVLNEAIEGMVIVKLMQRRAGSDDALGLDHVDFITTNIQSAVGELKEVDELSVVHESNDAHEWVSVRFGEREAKLVDHSVLDLCISELQGARDSLLA